MAILTDLKLFDFAVCDRCVNTYRDMSVQVYSGLSIKEILFPVQRVAKIEASWAAAIFFFSTFLFFSIKTFFFFFKNEKKSLQTHLF